MLTYYGCAYYGSAPCLPATHVLTDSLTGRLNLQTKPAVYYSLLTMAVLTMQTKPVVDYYSKLGLYSPIDANQKADTVKAAIAAILK